MRIAYLCCDFGVPFAGTKGASVHLREIASALRCLGHTVKVFTPSQDSSDHDESVSLLPLGGFGRNVVRLLEEDIDRSSHLVKEWRALLYAEHLQNALPPELAAFQPDVLYERYSLFAYAGVEIAARLRLPLLLEVNAPLALEQSKYRELALKRTAQELERMILRSADALIVVSQPLEDYARRLGVPDQKITLLPNSVDPARFHPAVSGQEVRSRFNLGAKPVLGFVASLKPWHDLDTLLAAVRLLARDNGGVHLLVVGEGPQLERLRGLEDGFVTSTGAVEHDLVPQFLAAMDVVAVPYSRTADPYFSPLKLYEAMAMARPIVGARFGQVAEALVDGESGLLYEPGNAEDLARKIGAVLRMPDRGAALGAAARQHVLATRTWEHNARRIVALAESLVVRRCRHTSRSR